MKKSKTEAKFFCENCGSEVSGKAKVCPVCGKFFSFVRCPKCGRTGLSDEFKNGCPDCGFAVQTDEDTSSSEVSEEARENVNKISRKRNRTQGSDSALPVWVYIVTLFVLIILIVCFCSCL